MQNPKFLGEKYAPEYSENYFSLLWYERDLITYFNHLKYKEMTDDPNFYFKNKKVIHFDMIHHQYKGDPRKKKQKKSIKQSVRMILRITLRVEKIRPFLQFSEINGMTCGSRET